MLKISGHGVAVAAAMVLVGCGAAASSANPPSISSASGDGPVQQLPETVISPYGADDLAAQFHEAQQQLLSDEFGKAVATFDRLVRLSPDGLTAAPSLYNAGLGYDAMGDRAVAVERFEALLQRFPDAPTARGALVRLTRLYAYLERWAELETTADRLLARSDLALLEQIEGLGARGLSAVERGDVAKAERDILSAQDLVDKHRLGEVGQPPVALAQVRFALGELRRARSEEITFVPTPDNFVDVLELRCQKLLSAQSAYSDAMRSLDAHWSAMAGFRVGELYQQLHRDVMAIPPPASAQTLNQKQLFEGAMRLRYRVLLEKGLTMMETTVSMGERTGESSMWITRAAAAKNALSLALEDERRAMQKLPFTEQELQDALDRLRGTKTP